MKSTAILSLSLASSLLSLVTALPQLPPKQPTASTVKFRINGKLETLPVLPNFQTKLELDKLDVRTAEVVDSYNVECALWSSARFEYFRFGHDYEITLDGSFPNADRVYCWAKDYDGETAVIVETTDKKEEVITLKRVAGTDSAQASLSPAIDVRRATAFVLATNTCFFAKDGDISQIFRGYGSQKAWSTPFRGATKVVCYSVLFR